MRHKPAIASRLWLLSLIGFFTGCALVSHGTTQAIPITTEPANATVTFNGEVRGRTPMTLVLSRTSRGEGVIRLEREGYEAQEWKTYRRMSGAFWGNLGFLVVGGIPFMALDGLTGSWANVYPHRLLDVKLDPVAKAVPAEADPR